MQDKAVHIEKEVIEVNLSKKDIRKMSVEAIAEDLLSIGEKAFRAKQIYEWLWVKSAASFEEMTNLSKKLRDWLEENYCINRISIASKYKLSFFFNHFILLKHIISDDFQVSFSIYPNTVIFPFDIVPPPGN